MSEDSKIGVEAAVKGLVNTAVFFRTAHKQLLDEWSPDLPPLTIVFSTLGRCLCCYSSKSSNQQLSEICNVVEELLSRGDDGVKDAVATGMLEAMLGESSAGRCDITTLARFFGAQTKAYCRSWDMSTGTQTPGLLDE